MDEKVYELALICVPGVGAQTAKTLLSYCGSAREVFQTSSKDLLQIPGVGQKMADSIRSEALLQKAEKEWQYMEETGVRLIMYYEPEYPQRLRTFFDGPVGVFYRGEATLNPPRMLSIIGTRKPTREGLAFCEQLIHDLLPYAPVIVSGLAYGIDICAHKTAMQQGLTTIGVMAHGHRYLYPATHRDIAQAMLNNGGLLSEYPSFVYPEKEYFPMRNRIVAGLCDAVVVVETGAKGGSIITANLANGYNKEVFAVPGRVHDSRSQGCNQLIKTHRAALLEGAADIAYILGWKNPQKAHGQQQVLFEELTDDEKIIVDLLAEETSVHVDHLMRQSQKSNSEMANLLLALEFKGLVQSKPGKHYALCR